MASSYRWVDLINYVAQSSPRLVADANAALLCDMVNSFIWAKADWRISLAKIPPFFVVPLQQDYVSPYISMPTDFLGLRAGTLTYNGTEPPLTYPPLMIDRYLSLTYSQGRIESLSYEASTGGIRVYPRPVSGIGPMDWQVECTYKKNPAKVTAATLASLGPPFDDQYFNTYVEGLKYWIKPASQQKQEDMANFIGMIDVMAAHEAVNTGDQPLSPRTPLVSW